MNTYFALMAELQKGFVPLESICADYLGMDYKTALRLASTQQLPVPVFKAGSQKSPWLVSLHDLAEHIDKRREEAKKNHKAMQGAA